MLVIANSLLPALPPSLSYLSVLPFLLLLFLLCMLEHPASPDRLSKSLFVVSVRGFERVLSFLLCVEG